MYIHVLTGILTRATAALDAARPTMGGVGFGGGPPVTEDGVRPPSSCPRAPKNSFPYKKIPGKLFALQKPRENICFTKITQAPLPNDGGRGGGVPPVTDNGVRAPTDSRGPLLTTDRGTSLIINSAPIGPCSRKLPRALWQP